MFREIFESFDKPYKWKNGTSTKDYKDFEFTAESGEYFVIFVMRGEGDNSYTAVSFENDDEKMDITDDGDAFRIFATVFDILLANKKEIVSHGYLKFSAPVNEPSRVKLYDRMTKVFAKKMGYTKTSKKTESGAFAHVWFELRK